MKIKNVKKYFGDFLLGYISDDEVYPVKRAVLNGEPVDGLLEILVEHGYNNVSVSALEKFVSKSLEGYRFNGRVNVFGTHKAITSLREQYGEKIEDK